MKLAYLALGTNLGNKKLNLKKAVKEIEKRIGHIKKLSAFYASKPWGFESDNNFVNAALSVETNLSPTELLEETQKIELDLGRTSKSTAKGYSDRVIDIDIIFYESEQIKTKELEIPHPYMHERDFVYIPIAEIAPDYIHPILEVKIKELIKGKHLLDKLK